jgi:hypothetical protein
MKRMLDRFALLLGRSRSVGKPLSSLKKKKKKSRECELFINSPKVDNGILHCSAQLSIPGKETQDVWFKLPKQYRPAVTHRADPFIIATLFAAAQSGRPLRVTGGSASPSLLRNLAEFQHVWHVWRGFDVIKIRAQTEPDRGRVDGPYLACFSGGIDSAYTIYRHAGGARSVRAHPGFTAIMAHGFDFPVDDEDGFRRAGERSRRMLESLGVPLILVKTNIRSLFPDWHVSHGTAAAAILTLLSGKFSTGLIAASGTYDLPLIPWGSNPLTDPMLGSRSFEIIHHGARASRLNKVRLLHKWHEGVKQLRFCFKKTPPDGNCGRCMKCILTALEFRCAGIEPGCFAEPVTDDVIIEVLGQYKPNAFGDFFFREVLNSALAQGMTDAWVMKLKETVATFGSGQ